MELSLQNVFGLVVTRGMEREKWKLVGIIKIYEWE